ncbi:recombinase family protein [Nonomuraea gerenzanensis]|uniref:Phage integrase n=1 Tax=Nonomuraea gerenzanensis TaxID=93944 RepID=A0A1M4DVH5_9ACTN|nr:recombinase family protein [Nonomuraea gerenzanensis]UBU12902.1 recombinase family protein [Nonomuraea gerenzanensis]SBO90558.1 Phage integrase [Nonomuraea gerenzanensis]
MPPATKPKIVRVVAAIRQSRTHDQTISPDLQRSIIENWISAKNQSSTDGTRWVIVGWAVDLDVSAGTTNPWERPELGPWLTDQGADQWDMLVSWKLDRLCRSALDFALLVKWLGERGKTLACTNDPIDLDTPIGRAVAAIMAILAELELETIRARSKENQRSLRANGRWGGGRIPFGRMLDTSDGTKKLVIDPEMYPVFLEIVAAVHEGRSITSIAIELNERNFPTAVDRQRQLKGLPTEGQLWSSANLWRMLKNRHLIGQKEYKGSVIRDDNGEPIIFFEPLLRMSEWTRLQTELDRRSINTTEESRRNTMLLRKVGSCGVCGGNVHQNFTVKNGKKYELRYRCASHTQQYNGTIARRCANGRIKAAELEGALIEAIMTRFGDKPWQEKVFVAGEDHTEELSQVEDAISSVRKEKDLGLYEGDEDAYMERLAALVARRKTLLAQPTRPSGYTYQPTGVTVAEHWAALDTEARNRLLIQWGVRISYDVTGGLPDIKIDLGDLERLEQLTQGLGDLTLASAL